MKSSHASQSSVFILCFMLAQEQTNLAKASLNDKLIFSLVGI